MEILAIDRVGRGALESVWIPTPGSKSAKVRVEAGLGGDLGVRIRGRSSPTEVMGGPPPFKVAEIAPNKEEVEIDLDGAGAVQVIADVGLGRRVRITLELSDTPLRKGQAAEGAARPASPNVGHDEP